ncbi:MAG: two-component system response regulator [Candidatus Handelsmanbacteria bacterium RIFCSPLOWO2_12_FULL_64_10]|uniref:Two-component system response regulator n=1 Tax=Handelsmanbacteria sp. (strain RIFCSPLOWO2_12_FULL_64_10) TaxID=1817868 RepID=A0A1F6CBK6_HANXR|nr:MAG: two-component system response regulator [Candidatus Handelsmanbacteria bacterium RIFCSPLOWO2_12_FULL_64_10]
MNEYRKRGTILIAEDDEEDLLLTQEALEECEFTGDLQSVKDGEELMDYLHRRGKYGRVQPSKPALILLDLRMPRKDGYEALQEIRSDPDLRLIPVVVLTTSRMEEDVYHSYTLGANSYIAKPDAFEGLVEALRVLERYWFEVVSLPRINGAEERPSTS